MSDERDESKYNRTGGLENLTDDQRRVYHEEIEPLMDQLQEVAQKHGYFGATTLQIASRVHQGESKDEEGLGFTVGTFLHNPEHVRDGADDFNKKHEGGVNSLDELKEYMEQSGYQVPSPLVTAVVGMIYGHIDPAKTLERFGSHNEAYAALEKLLGSDKLNLTPTQRDNLRQAFGFPPEGEKKKKDTKTIYAEVHGKDGQLIGFRDVVTGERDYFDGFGPDDDPTLNASGGAN